GGSGRGGGRRAARLAALRLGRRGVEELGLELRPALPGVAVGRAPDLVGARRWLAQDGFGLFLRPPGELLLANHGLSPLRCLVDDPGGLRLGLGKQALLLLQGPASLLYLIRKTEPQVVDQAQRLLLVYHHGAGERNLPAVRDQVLDAVDGVVDAHDFSPFLPRRCCSGCTT